MAAKWSQVKSNLKRRNVQGALQEISAPKIMALPPCNFIGSDNIRTFIEDSPVIVHQDVETTEQPDEFIMEEHIDEYAGGDDESEQDEESNDDRPHQNAHDPAICCAQCRALNMLLLQKINRLVELVQGDRPDRRDGGMSLLPPMPFTDTAALAKFDSDLKENEEMRKQFRQKIQQIGGRNTQKAVRYSIEAVIADELAQQVVWVLGSDDKPKLSTYDFPRIIIEVIRNSFRDTTTKDIENRIADWLRRGGDRLKAAKVAAKKRTSHGTAAL